MATSQNGYKANDRSLIKTYSAGGARFPVRKGDVATVLMYVAERFSKTVEKLDKNECYGYAERNIRGSSTTLSNHASGTAIDLNSSKHWLGDVGTFTKKQQAAIRKILNYCGGVVRWGGDYHSRKDEMHFEINKSPAAVAALAKKINGGGGSVDPDITPKTGGILGMALKAQDSRTENRTAAKGKEMTLHTHAKNTNSLLCTVKKGESVLVDVHGRISGMREGETCEVWLRAGEYVKKTGKGYTRYDYGRVTVHGRPGGGDVHYAYTKTDKVNLAPKHGGEIRLYVVIKNVSAGTCRSEWVDFKVWGD